ncbi:MAG: M56 family metallopeptidase [Bryobacteraceae bacterium]
MTWIQFLAEWDLRSSILILGGALLLRALRVKDPSICSAAWTAMLCGSLAIPALTAALPKAPLAVMRVASGRVEAPAVVYDALREPVRAVSPSDVGAERHGSGVSKRFDWARAAMGIYVLVAIALLLRLCFGLAISLRLLRGSRVTGQATEGIEIRESDRVAMPVTLGIARPAIVLPGDWRQWDGAKMDAVLAHERSHIRRHDPAVQLLSAMHRVLLWHNPLSWFLHRRIVRAAEEASDDAAVAVTRDRALYAEVLLDFMQGPRGALVRGPGWLGVPMARYGPADERIHRILDGTVLSRGVTRWSLAAILALGSPLAYVVVAAGPEGGPQSAPQAQAAPVQATVGAPPGGRLMAPQIVPNRRLRPSRNPVPLIFLVWVTSPPTRLP